MKTAPNKFTGLTTKVCRRVAVIAVAVVGCLYVPGAAAGTITLGSRIDLTPDLFALPITITDAVDVTAWEFDLGYDPLDLQINTACDPFSGDVYCSLFTGPVTEGDFFASISPFNVFNPGFIDLDPITLQQTGLLFAVSSAFGGFSPGVSGDGVLAYVEFLKVGQGTSNVTLNPTAVVPVPEPGTLALMASGLLLVGRRLRRKAGLDGQ